jgi:hypothetical protein
MPNQFLTYGLSTDADNFWAITTSQHHGLWHEVEALGRFYDFADFSDFEEAIDAREGAGEKGLWDEIWAAEDRLRGTKKTA